LFFWPEFSAYISLWSCPLSWLAPPPHLPFSLPNLRRKPASILIWVLEAVDQQSALPHPVSIPLPLVGILSSRSPNAGKSLTLPRGYADYSPIWNYIPPCPFLLLRFAKREVSAASKDSRPRQFGLSPSFFLDRIFSRALSGCSYTSFRSQEGGPYWPSK